MKLFHKSILFSLIFALVWHSGVLALDETEEIIIEDKTGKALQTIDAKVEVNESVIERAADNYMLSVQCEIFHQADFFLADGTLSLSEKYTSFAAENPYRFPLFRWGGASSEKFNPILNIGALSTRKESVNITTGTAGSMAHRLGPVEFIKFMQAINPEAEFLPNYSVSHATPQDNANLTAFLTHKAGESEWGTLRASLGIVEPVKVFAFELGNEIDLNPAGGWVFSQEKLDWYIPVAKANIEAILSVYPEAKFVICGKTAPWAESPSPGVKEDWRKWTVGIAQGLGEYMDYLSLHPYYDGHAVSYMDYFFDAITEDMNTVLGEDHRAKILITEHARYGTNNESTMINLFSALSTAQFFNRTYRRPNIAGATYHNIFSQGNWWSLFQYRENEFMQTGVGDMFKVYGKGIGDRIVASDVTSGNPVTDIKSTQLRFTALASPKGENEMNLILNNASEDFDFNLTFEFENNYTLVEETVFTAPNLKSFVYNKQYKDIFVTSVTEKNEKDFTSYNMPSKSLVILKLISNKPLPVLNGNGSTEDDETELESSESYFDDTSHHWAQREIDKMKELGYVSGISDNLFVPEGMITRGEFSAIAGRMIGVDTDYPNIFFSDIADDAWYQPYVNALYCEGFIKGKDAKLFSPDTPITLEEILLIANRIYRADKPSQSESESESESGIGDSMQIPTVNVQTSPWAKQEVMFSVSKGLLYRLYENGGLRTFENATRAQAVSVMYRLYQLIK